VRSRGCVIVLAGRVHEPLGFDVSVPNTSESLDVPHFCRPDVDFADLTDGNCLVVTPDVISLDAERVPLSVLPAPIVPRNSSGIGIPASRQCQIKPSFRKWSSFAIASFKQAILSLW
jgi:hypothetical protein